MVFFIYIPILIEQPKREQWRRVVRRLIWVFIVCLCPTKRTLGINGLKSYLLRAKKTESVEYISFLGQTRLISVN